MYPVSIFGTSFFFSYCTEFMCTVVANCHVHILSQSLRNMDVQLVNYYIINNVKTMKQCSCFTVGCLHFNSDVSKLH